MINKVLGRCTIVSIYYVAAYTWGSISGGVVYSTSVNGGHQKSSKMKSEGKFIR